MFVWLQERLQYAAWDAEYSDDEYGEEYGEDEEELEWGESKGEGISFPASKEDQHREEDMFNPDAFGSGKDRRK